MSYSDDWENGDSEFWEQYMGGDDCDKYDDHCCDDYWPETVDSVLESEQRDGFDDCYPTFGSFYFGSNDSIVIEVKQFLYQQQEANKYDYSSENFYDDSYAFQCQELVCVGECFCLIIKNRLFFSPSFGRPFFNPLKKDFKYKDLYTKCEDDFTAVPDITREAYFDSESTDSVCIDLDIRRVDNFSESPAQILLNKLMGF